VCFVEVFFSSFHFFHHHSLSSCNRLCNRHTPQQQQQQQQQHLFTIGWRCKSVRVCVRERESVCVYTPFVSNPEIQDSKNKRDKNGIVSSLLSI